MTALRGLEFDSMRNVLRPGMLTFDVGAHDGNTSLLIAESVGPENVVIIEPHPENWARIQWSWEKQYEKKMPAATFQGFVSDQVSENSCINIKKWPDDLNCHTILPGGDGPFGSLKEPAHDKWGRTTLDELSLKIGGPAALLIDIEGSELLVLRAATAMISCHHPKMWVSIHPELMKLFGTNINQLFDLMHNFGYKKTYLGEEQELYYLFE